MEDIPNLVASPLKLAKFVDLLFIQCNPNVLFLREIHKMFLGWNYFKGLELVEEAMKAGNLKAMYLFCMLELLNGPHLESFDVVRVFSLLRPLKNTADMMWLRRITIEQFSREWNDGSEINVVGWLECHGNCDISEFVGLLPEWVVDCYDDKPWIYCKANREIAYFVYMFTGHYGLPF